MEESNRGKMNQAGFTLIELLVSILILAIGIIGVLSLLSLGYSHVGDSGRISTMNHLGQQKLDQLRRTAFTSPDLLAGLHPSSGPERYTVLDDYGSNVYTEYTVRWTVTDTTPQANMKRVVVEVGHQLYNGSTKRTEQLLHTKEIRFQRYLAR